MEGELTRAWKRLKKKNGWDNEAKTESDIRELMIRFSPVPRGMAEEMADFYLPSPLSQDALCKSDEILELLTGSWAAQGSCLEEDDWEFLKEQVNEWAPEMDMDVVTSVMKAVVERGDFSR
jgi:hypothetical protein